MSAAELSEHLQASGCQTSVYTTLANGREELDLPAGKPLNCNGVTVTYFKRITQDHTHLSPGLLKALWQNARSFDLIHIHAWWNLVSILSAIIALRRRVPVVISPRGTLSAYSFQHKNSAVKRNLHRLLSRLVLNRCHIHATSPQEETDLRHITRALSYTTLPNFVQLPQQTAHIGKQAARPFKLLFYSRIDAKKGLDLLLNALPLLHTPYRLTVAGTGEDDYINYLRKLTETNHTHQYVDWIGFQNENKFDLLRQHDLMILPSYNENFGNVVIESLSAGTAVLISKYVGLAEYVLQHHLGWVCDTTPVSIAEGIDLISGRTQELQDINTNAPELIYNDFTGDALTKQYISLYRQIVTQALAADQR